MSSYRDSSHPSIEEIPLTPTDNESFSPSSVMRDSIITYTTDLGSSVESMSGAADDTVIGERKPTRSVPGQGPSSNFYRRKRFWAICMATTVVLSAIFIPLFFLVIIPSIAQKAINDSELNIISMNVTNPTEDGFDTEMVGQSLHAGDFDATLKFVGPLNVIYENQLIGTISTLDPLEISKGQGLLKVPSGKFKIANIPLFENFTRDSMSETSFEWTIQGNVKVQTFGITTRILNLNKSIKVPGAGGFSNTTLRDLKVSLNTDQSLHLEMETNINNPSPMGMEIGNLFLQVQYGGTTLANLTSDYFILTSGENILTLKGDAKFPTNDVDKNNTIKLIEAFIANQPVTATSKALYTVLKDGATSGWLNDTIKSLTLQTVVGNRPNPPPTIKQVDFGETNLVFTPETAYAPTMTAKGASSGFVSPFDMPFEIETIQQNLTIYFQGKPVIEFDTPSLSATSANSTVTFDLPSTPMKALDDAHDLFADFIASLSSQPETDVQLVGSTSIKAKTPLGEFPLNGIPFKIPFKMPGFNLFSQTPKIGNPSIKSFDASQLVVEVDMTYTNPTKGGMTMGPVNFQLVYQDQQIGTVAIENLTFVPGPSTLNVQITLPNPLQSPVITSLIGGSGSTVYIMGYDGSTNIDSLKKLFSGLKVPAPLPSISSASAATKSVLSQLSPNP